MGKLSIIDDVSINVPTSLEKIYSNFEPCTTRIIRETLTKGATFVDVGANIGYFSALASNLVGASGQVFAVEGSPAVLPLLEANLNSLTNASIVRTALGARNGYTDFYLTDDYVNSGVAKNPFNNHSIKTSVPIARLSDLHSNGQLGNRPLDFIKCDVQGDEVAVLEGARELIEKSTQMLLIVEWAPSWMNNAGYESSEFPDYLRSLGFNSILVIDDWTEQIMSLDEMRLEFLRDDSGKRFCNLFASKSTHYKAINGWISKSSEK